MILNLNTQLLKQKLYCTAHFCCQYNFTYFKSGWSVIAEHTAGAQAIFARIPMQISCVSKTEKGNMSILKAIIKDTAYM